MLKHNYLYRHKGMTILVITSCLFISQICTHAFGKNFKVQKETDDFGGKEVTTLSCESIDGKATLKVIHDGSDTVRLVIQTPYVINAEKLTKYGQPQALIHLETTETDEKANHYMFIDKQTSKNVTLYLHPRYGDWYETFGSAVAGNSLSTMLGGKKFRASVVGYDDATFTWDLQTDGSEEFREALMEIKAKSEKRPKTAAAPIPQFPHLNSASDNIKIGVQETAYTDANALRARLRRPVNRQIVEVRANEGARRHRYTNEDGVLKKDWYVEAYLQAFGVL